MEKILFGVVVTEKGEKILPEGSVIEVHKILKKHYKGFWYSYLGSFEVKILKKYCKRIK